MTWVIGLTILAYIVTLYVRHQRRQARRRVELLRAQGWTML